MELKRNYSLDLLKIISIIFVIILHYNNGTMGGYYLIHSLGHQIILLHVLLKFLLLLRVIYLYLFLDIFYAKAIK